ncbi:MAG: alanine racemase, partial [Actinomycetota bacterium]
PPREPPPAETVAVALDDSPEALHAGCQRSDSAITRCRVDAMAARIEGIVPVVKGNGYGFGREWLAERAALLAPMMAVGTVYEVDSVPSNYSALVLTPALAIPDGLRDNAILTVGSSTHVEAAANGSGQRRVVVKVRSTMNRYGFDADEVDNSISLCRRKGLAVAGVSIHPPLHGSNADHRHEIESLIGSIDPVLPIYVSHLDESEYDILRASHPDRAWNLRVGTSLWHGDKKELSLSADVLDVHTIEINSIAGYRGRPVRRGDRLVIVGCGSAHGVAPLDGGLSPFHYARQRLALLESPHMHTSMCVLSAEQACPSVGDSVDVQRPLTTTNVDIVHWT